jgi:uncharacterized membrane protein
MSTENVTGTPANQSDAQAPVNHAGLNSEPAAAPQAAVPPAAMPVEQTPVERMASDAYQHTSEAADALRRGELMQNSQIDPLADSDDRLIALLSYATQIIIPVIMPVIVLLSESSKKRPFQRYHAVQSLALSVAFWGLLVMAGIGTAVIQIIPVLGFLIGIMMACLVPIAWSVQALMLLYYGFQAYKGRRFAIPGLTSFLRDQNWI